jgi:hypothetical protein
MVKKQQFLNIAISVHYRNRGSQIFTKTHRSDYGKTNPDLIGHGSGSGSATFFLRSAKTLITRAMLQPILHIYISCLSLYTLTFLISVQNCSQGRNSPESHSCSKFLHLFAFPGTLNVYFATGGREICIDAALSIG